MKDNTNLLYKWRCRERKSTFNFKEKDSSLFVKVSGIIKWRSLLEYYILYKLMRKIPDEKTNTKKGKNR